MNSKKIEIFKPIKIPIELKTKFKINNITVENCKEILEKCIREIFPSITISIEHQKEGGIKLSMGVFTIETDIHFDNIKEAEIWVYSKALGILIDIYDNTKIKMKQIEEEKLFNYHDANKNKVKNMMNKLNINNASHEILNIRKSTVYNNKIQNEIIENEIIENEIIENEIIENEIIENEAIENEIIENEIIENEVENKVIEEIVENTVIEKYTVKYNDINNYSKNDNIRRNIIELKSNDIYKKEVNKINQNINLENINLDNKINDNIIYNESNILNDNIYFNEFKFDDINKASQIVDNTNIDDKNKIKKKNNLINKRSYMNEYVFNKNKDKKNNLINQIEKDNLNLKEDEDNIDDLLKGVIIKKMDDDGFSKIKKKKSNDKETKNNLKNQKLLTKGDFEKLIKKHESIEFQYFKSIRTFCTIYKVYPPEFEIIRENDVYRCTGIFNNINFVSSYEYDKYTAKEEICKKIYEYIFQNWNKLTKNYIIE